MGGVGNITEKKCFLSIKVLYSRKYTIFVNIALQINCFYISKGCRTLLKEKMGVTLSPIGKSRNSRWQLRCSPKT